MKWPLLLVTAAAISGCTTSMADPGSEPGDTIRPPAEAGACNAQAGQVLVGQQATSATGQRALELTGATSLRWGPPGAVFTMDYREDRVNLMYDENSMITEVRCG